MLQQIRLCLFFLLISSLQLVAIGHAQVVSPTFSHIPPEDVSIPDGFSGDPVFHFDLFSWETFVALNWPALEGQRGKPDSTKVLGAATDHVVWGTWKADHETFQPNGMEPSPWESFEAQSPDRFTAFSNAGKVKVLGGFGLRGSELQIEHYNQAGIAGQEKGTLVDRNRRYIRYEVRINKPEYNFIRNGRFYLASNLPATGQLIFPEGSGEIKAAWRTFTDTELNDPNLLSRYYTTEAVLVDPSGLRTNTRIGLIGLHIVRRTKSRPEWIWSSFEHVDNLSGNSPTLMLSNGSANENTLRQVVNRENPPLPDPDPVPVRRIRPIRNETVQVNNAYRNHDTVKDTVWKNYQLVLTQWPSTPAANEQEFLQRFESGQYPNDAGAPSPTDSSGKSIANITMETSPVFQQAVSCMRCHFNAGKLRRTEFVWTVPLRAFESDPGEVQRLKNNLQLNIKPFMDSLNSEIRHN